MFNEKGRKINVEFVGNAKIEYDKLIEIVKEELSKEKYGTENQKLLKSIERSVYYLKNNPFFGTQIPKALIPKEYVINYKADNLWKCDLIGFWRLIYTVMSDEVEIVSIVLEFMDHKEYNNRFGYN